MKKLIAALVLVSLISVMFASALAVTAQCTSCGKIVQLQNPRCKGGTKRYGSWTACDRGNGCLNYRFYNYTTYYNCPVHTSKEIAYGSHTHGTEHEVSSHNRVSCPY